jgi:hypothetical protein
MTHAVTQLPPDHGRLAELNLAVDWKRGRLLQAVAALVWAVVLVATVELGERLRTALGRSDQLSVPPISDMWVAVAGMVALLVLAGGISAVLGVLHELTHGCVVWYYTRQPPRFGQTGLLFWCAPQRGWYLAPPAFVCAALAPLAALTVMGITLLLTGPWWLALLLAWAIPINVAASVGDVHRGRRGRRRVPRSRSWRPRGSQLARALLAHAAIGDQRARIRGYDLPPHVRCIVTCGRSIGGRPATLFTATCARRSNSPERRPSHYSPVP